MRMLLPTIALMGSLAGPLAAGVDGMTAQTPQRMAAVQSPPAQTPPPPAQTPAKPAPKPAAPRPRTQKPAADTGASARALVLTVQVTDIRGAGQGEVKITSSGPVIREGVTDGGGIARIAGMRPGDYRIRLEREGLITLERDLTLVAGKSMAVDITMSTAPTPPPPPPTTPAPTASAAAGPPGEARTLSLQDFIEKNLIGREPMKQTTLGCSGNLQAVLLQIREPLAEQTDDQLDVTLYVVAGQGSLKLAGRDSGLTPASFAVIPRGTPYSLSRKGGTPLIVLLNRANQACADAK